MPKSVEYSLRRPLTSDLRLRKLIKKLRATDNLIRYVRSPPFAEGYSSEPVREVGKEHEGENHESVPLSVVLSVTLRPRTVPHERKSSNYRPAPIAFGSFGSLGRKSTCTRVVEWGGGRCHGVFNYFNRGRPEHGEGVGRVLKMGVNARDNLHSVIW